MQAQRMTWPGMEGDPSPEDIRKEFPPWSAYIDTNGTYVAKRTVVLHDVSPTDLRNKIAEWERLNES
jgi:hypothetical protein